MEPPPPPDSGRLALVTGASRGIGLATARRLADDGYHVVLSARSASVIEEHAAQLREAGRFATAIPCDMADRASVARLLGRLEDAGQLSVLVNNAGMLPVARRAELVDYDDWDLALEVNLTAPWYLATRARKLMRAGSAVVNITSSAAYYPSRGLVSYNVSKAAQVMLTRVLALEWARDGIRVVGIAPGKVDTELLEPITAWVHERGLELNPMRRLGRSEEIAALVSYLVSDAAAFVTGVIVPIDGGELLSTGAEGSR